MSRFAKWSAALDLSRSRAHVRRYDRDIDTLCGDRALVDVAQGIDPESGFPTTSLNIVLGRHAIAVDELATFQAGEYLESHAALDDARAYLDGLTNSQDPDRPGVRVPFRALLVVWFLLLVVLGLLVAETMLLIPPINEVLQSGIGFTREATSAAAILTTIGAVLAHFRAHAFEKASEAKVGPDRETSAATANAFTIALIAVAGAAVGARVYASMLTVGAVDPSAIAFFTVLQLVFLLAALMLPKALIEIRRRINTLYLEKAKDEAEVTLGKLVRAQQSAEEEHNRQREQIDDSTESGMWRYLADVVNLHPDIEMAEDWRALAANLRLDGGLRALITGEPAHLVGRATDLPAGPPPGDDGGNPPPTGGDGAVDGDGAAGAGGGPAGAGGGHGAYGANGGEPAAGTPTSGERASSAGPGAGGPRASRPRQRPGSHREPAAGPDTAPPTGDWTGYSSPEDLFNDIVREAS